MAKLRKEFRNANDSMKASSARGNKSSVATLKPNENRTPNKPDIGKATAAPPLAHKQIEERAKEIWIKKGCPAGQDEKNWLEAEEQLKREVGVK